MSHPPNVDPETGEVLPEGQGYVDPTTGAVHVPDPHDPAGGGDNPPARPENTVAVRDTDLGRMLADARTRAMEDPDEVAKTIVERILAASTVEEVLGGQEVRHARDLLDVPIVVEAIRFNQSDFGEGFGFYCIVEGMDAETGERVVASCGGRSVMAQLYRLHQLGAFPCKVKFTQPLRPTRAGFWPLWLQAAT